MIDPVTAVKVGGSIVKGVGGYKAGQAGSKSAMATAEYNRMLTEINAKMQTDKGLIERAIGERNAQDVAEQASYNAFVLERQAEEVQLQNDFDFFVAERQVDIFTAQKRARWGASGVTMRGSPAVVALADAHAGAMNLANVQQRGLQAVSRVEQAAEMTRYQGKVAYNNMMQSAFMRNYASDIQRANIINEGSVNYYQNALKAYQAQAQGTQALIGGFTDAAMAGAQGYADAGGTFDFDWGSGASSTSLGYDPFSSMGFDDWLVQGGASGGSYNGFSKDMSGLEMGASGLQLK